MKTKDELRKRYRVVTDGETFRIQRKWWLLGWRFVLTYFTDSAEFATAEKARQAIEKLVNEDYSEQDEAWVIC